MTIRVLNKDNTYDIVSAFSLQRLIDAGKIKMFYRYSEKRWVEIGQDPIRSRDKGFREADRRVGLAVMQQV